MLTGFEEAVRKKREIFMDKRDEIATETGRVKRQRKRKKYDSTEYTSGEGYSKSNASSGEEDPTLSKTKKGNNSIILIRRQTKFVF